MTWYTVYYGSWTEPNGVKIYACTHDRKEAFTVASALSETLNKEVTVSAERGSAKGLYCRYYKFEKGELQK